MKSFGRVYPFCYKIDEADSELRYLLCFMRPIWLLDIRYDPEDSWPEYRGEWLKEVRSQEYRHAKGLGLVAGTLYHPDSAVRKMLEMMERGESFLLFANSWEHCRQVEQLVHRRGKEQQLALENPYVFGPGDVCLWKEYQVNVVLTMRLLTLPYSFYVDILPGQETFSTSGSVDLQALTLIEQGTYRCAKCGRGDKRTRWYEKPAQKLCGHCFWRWELEYGED